MDQCPHCGAELPVDTVQESATEKQLSGDGSELSEEGKALAENREPVPKEVTCPECDATVDTSQTGGDKWNTASSGATRREMLTYGGGSALLTLGAIGAGWFTFFYEQRSPEEELVREYVDALDRSHFYTASQLFHEDAPGEAWTANEIPDVDQVDMSVDGTEVVDREDEVDITTVQELALVIAEIAIDGGMESQTMEVGFVLAKNQDGEWKLWEDR